MFFLNHKIKFSEKYLLKCLEQNSKNPVALNNLGIFNHAVAGLSEIIGIIFLSFSISIIYVWKNNINGQLPLFLSILLIQVLILLNFLRYIFTDSPGETTIESITLNAFIFLLGGLVNSLFIIINFRNLK